MNKKYLELQHSESVVISAAAQIYAAYISNGQVGEDKDQWMKLSIQEAMKIASTVDKMLVSDGEMS